MQRGTIRIYNMYISASLRLSACGLSKIIVRIQASVQLSHSNVGCCGMSPQCPTETIRWPQKLSYVRMYICFVCEHAWIHTHGPCVCIKFLIQSFHPSHTFNIWEICEVTEAIWLQSNTSWYVEITALLPIRTYIRMYVCIIIVSFWVCIHSLGGTEMRHILKNAIIVNTLLPLPPTNGVYA